MTGCPFPLYFVQISDLFSDLNLNADKDLKENIRAPMALLIIS